MTYLVRCITCGRELEIESPMSDVCPCGSRCFGWDDHAVGRAREQKVAELERQGRTSS